MSIVFKQGDLKCVGGAGAGGSALPPHAKCDRSSSSSETVRFQVILSGRRGRQGKEKDEKEDEKPQIQSGTVRGTEGK